jgi:non-specific protein-tyrosine kinase
MSTGGFFHVLRRRLLAVILCVLAGVGGALLLTDQTVKVYQADARVIVNLPVATTITQAGQGLQLTSELLPSYAELAESRLVADKVKQALNLPESSESLRKRLSAQAAPKTLLIDIGARDRDPVRARSIADAAAKALSDAVADLQGGRPKETAVTIDVIDSAITPQTPVEPRPTYNLALGLLLGLAAGALLALALDAMDRSVKSATQAEEVTDAPLLGVVPSKKGRGRLVSEKDSASAEAYRALRPAVRFVDPDNPPAVLMVTSPSAGEGKTSTAVNLAVALASSGVSVALVDADLRRASVAKTLGLEGAVGVTSVVTRTATLDDALQRWRDNLLVLPAGPLPPNPSEILGSEAMANLLADLREWADMIVVDAAPVLPVTDAVVLSTLVDGVLIVLRSGRTQRALAAEARRRLGGVGAAVVGCVLNAAKSSTAEGYYASYRPQAAAGRAAR